MALYSDWCTNFLFFHWLGGSVLWEAAHGWLLDPGTFSLSLVLLGLADPSWPGPSLSWMGGLEAILPLMTNMLGPWSPLPVGVWSSFRFLPGCSVCFLLPLFLLPPSSWGESGLETSACHLSHLLLPGEEEDDDGDTCPCWSCSAGAGLSSGWLDGPVFLLLFCLSGSGVLPCPFLCVSG